MLSGVLERNYETFELTVLGGLFGGRDASIGESSEMSMASARADHAAARTMARIGMKFFTKNLLSKDQGNMVRDEEPKLPA